MSALLPFVVAVPLAAAALLLLVGRWLPWRLPDVIALVAALGVLLIAVVIALAAAPGPLVYWFGGWPPRHGLAIGIGFVASQADALVGALIALLFAASFVFAWGYFEDIRAFFHVLMLAFLGGMEGFCFTHDLFNMFVWFELMSVAAFALTAYRLEASSLEGALNFTVTNSIASFLMMGGIGLLYLQAGQLDFGTLGRSVAAAPHDPAAAGAFCLLAGALLIKGAVVPFQFWLADAHAVAPSPVSVIFSGAMVPLALFGLAKLYWEVFAADPAVTTLMQTLLVGMGVVSAIVGGAACLRQRHMKRLLAFSTIAHVGIMLVGVGLLTPRGLAGMLLYLVGHGLVKGALFMIAGILLATLGGIDEIDLRGHGGKILPAGIALAIAGLLLGGAPVGLLDEGSRLIDTAAHDAGVAWILPAVIISTALTGAAVLRVAGRVFLGWGAEPGEERDAPTEEETEKPNRPLWLMMLPVCLLLLVAITLGLHQADDFARRAAARFIAWDGGASLGHLPVPQVPALQPPSHPFAPWLSVGLAVVIAAHDLVRDHLPQRWVRIADRILNPLYFVIGRLHDGVVGDYVAWIVAGLSVLSLGLYATAR